MNSITGETQAEERGDTGPTSFDLLTVALFLLIVAGCFGIVATGSILWGPDHPTTHAERVERGMQPDPPCHNNRRWVSDE